MAATKGKTFHGPNLYRDKQHLLTLIAVGGLYEPDAADMIREALAPDPNIQRAILDLGMSLPCSCRWLIGMMKRKEEKTKSRFVSGCGGGNWCDRQKAPQ